MTLLPVMVQLWFGCRSGVVLWLLSGVLRVALTPIDQQERKTYDFDGDETKTGSARLVVYVGAM